MGSVSVMRRVSSKDRLVPVLQPHCGGKGHSPTGTLAPPDGNEGDGPRFLTELLEGLRLINRSAKKCCGHKTVKDVIYRAKTELLVTLMEEVTDLVHVSAQHDERGTWTGLVVVADPFGPARAFHIPLEHLPQSRLAELWNSGALSRR